MRETNLNTDGMITVAFDCDGVLGDFKGRYLHTVNMLTGLQFSIDAVTTLKIEESPFFAEAQAAFEAKQGEGASLKAAVAAEVEKPGWCEGMPAYHAAQQAFKRLRAATQHKSGKPLLDIFCVTSPWDSCPTWGYERLRWLIKHFDFDRQHVVLTGAKQLIRADILVEDMPHVLNHWLDTQQYHGKLGLLLDHPYNRQIRLSYGGERAYNWDQVEGAINDFYSRR